MENKLQQLTEKLYNEGLEKGRLEAQQVLDAAKSQANDIVEKAKTQAAQIVQDATQKAAELTKNTANDIRMASAQTLSALRSNIEQMVLTSVIEPKVSAAWADSSFVKGLICDAVKAWNPNSSAPVRVAVPENMVDEVKAAIADKFKDGVDVVFNGKVRVPFRIAPANGSYYVSFTDSDFTALICESLRESVVKMLFEKQ